MLQTCVLSVSYGCCKCFICTLHTEYFCFKLFYMFHVTSVLSVDSCMRVRNGADMDCPHVHARNKAARDDTHPQVWGPAIMNFTLSYNIAINNKFVTKNSCDKKWYKFIAINFHYKIVTLIRNKFGTHFILIKFLWQKNFAINL